MSIELWVAFVMSGASLIISFGSPVLTAYLNKNKQDVDLLGPLRKEINDIRTEYETKLTILRNDFSDYKKKAEAMEAKMLARIDELEKENYELRTRPTHRLPRHD